MFISFEGVDGSGKSTQIKMLSKHLSANGFPYILTKEPGGTNIGSQIRKILLDPENTDIANKCELMLYMADRVQHYETKIKPALDNNITVLSDRYHDSTVAIQHYARGVSGEYIETLFTANSLPLPDLTFILDMDAEVALLRARQQTGKGGDRIEMEAVDFHERVRDGLKAISRQPNRRIYVVDAMRSVNIISSDIINIYNKVKQELTYSGISI